MNDKDELPRLQRRRQIQEAKRVRDEYCAWQPVKYTICSKCFGQAHFLDKALLEEHTEEGVNPVLVSEMSICLNVGCEQLVAETKGKKLWHGRFPVLQAVYVPRQPANSF